MHETHVDGQEIWKTIKGIQIPGSTRTPIIEISNFFKRKTGGLIGLDLGSGKGRSTHELQQLSGTSITAADLSISGLRETDAGSRVQANAERLPFADLSYDFVNLCGVMTNLVAENPEQSISLRKKVLNEVARVLKKNGCVVISDFSSLHLFDGYDVSYPRHALITGEMGTIAVLKKGTTFAGLSDHEVAALKNTDAIQRYAHHYSPAELIVLVQNSGLEVVQYTIELGKTPSGNAIENIILVAKK